MEDRKAGIGFRNETGPDKKRKLQHLFLTVMTVVLLGRAEPAMAALTAEDAIDNVVLVTAGKMHIEEEFQPPQDPEPGTAFIKKPAVFNDSTADCFVRIQILFSDSAAAELLKPLSVNQGWSLGDDGAWYYTERLLPGTSTTPVFSNVEFKADVTKEEIEAVLPFEILIYAESVTAGNRNLQTAWDLLKGGTN